MYNDTNPNAYLGRVVLNFNATLGAGLDETGQKSRSFVNAFSFTKICQGFCEINGLFWKQDRYGNAKLVSLKDTLASNGYDHLYDLGIPMSRYKEFWWDEYDIEPIGQVVYSYPVKTEYGNEMESDILEVGEGGSVYDLSDNYVLQSLDNANRNYIETIIRYAFYPAIKNIYFTPIELYSLGYPQLEAGDRLQITIADNSKIYTYALQCELSGIQNLQEYVQTSVGEIISEEGESDE